MFSGTLSDVSVREWWCRVSNISFIVIRSYQNYIISQGGSASGDWRCRGGGTLARHFVREGIIYYYNIIGGIKYTESFPDTQLTV